MRSAAADSTSGSTNMLSKAVNGWTLMSESISVSLPEISLSAMAAIRGGQLVRPTASHECFSSRTGLVCLVDAEVAVS